MEETATIYTKDNEGSGNQWETQLQTTDMEVKLNTQRLMIAKKKRKDAQMNRKTGERHKETRLKEQNGNTKGN